MAKEMVVAGLDEAGRGPLAGPVYAAVVVWSEQTKLSGLKDSKLMSAIQREAMYDRIISTADGFAIAFATVEEIDTHNILQATFLAMRRAIQMINVHYDKVLVDGNLLPPLNTTAQVTAVIQGDRTVMAISAASVLAKVARDREMLLWDQHYPDYRFVNHKGYGTPEHLAALRQFGPCPIHRRSFAPVRELMSTIS
jgi:ribonuclease HII